MLHLSQQLLHVSLTPLGREVAGERTVEKKIKQTAYPFLRMPYPFEQSQSLHCVLLELNLLLQRRNMDDEAFKPSDVNPSHDCATTDGRDLVYYSWTQLKLESKEGG